VLNIRRILKTALVRRNVLKRLASSFFSVITKLNTVFEKRYLVDTNYNKNKFDFEYKFYIWEKIQR